MPELDPDVLRWGLHLLDVCSLTNDSSEGIVTCYDKDFSQVEYVREGYCESVHSTEENDEMIARAYQEELSRIPASEASRSSHGNEENQQQLILDQNWHFHSDCGSNQEDAYEVGTLRISPSQRESDLLGLDYESGFPEIEDESVLDGEVGKRLNQMISVAHVPKINGEIPSVDEATSDHQRLIDRLQLYDLVEQKVSGDGNCQFRSLSDQIYRTSDHHKFVRQQIVHQLKSHPELYEGYVPMSFSEYLKRMSKGGEWGDHVTLQAAADSYGVRIFVITSFKDTCYIEIIPQVQKSNRIITLSFWAEVHYNSIYPHGELPEVESKKKKKWWMPGH